MKKWITAGVTVLGLALVLALTVLVLQQNGFLAKPVSPAPAAPGDTGASLGEKAETQGAENDALQEYLENQEIKKNGAAILMPGAGFRMPYWELTVDKEAHYADVHYKDYFITKNRADLQVEWTEGFTYHAEFDRKGNITNGYSYVAVEFDITCDSDWTYFAAAYYFYPITYHSYWNIQGNDTWNYAFGGELYAWNPQTANPQYPCERNPEWGNKAYTLRAGVAYSVRYVFLMQDKYLPEEELILLHVGDSPPKTRDPVTKEMYNTPIPILSAEGETLATYTCNDPIRDEGWFPHRELP